MSLALENYNRVFALHIRCANCIRESVKEICGGEAGPTNVDELVESGLIEKVRFECFQCESVIGQLVAITELKG
ncbi:hypothetical protein [Phyllobacterium lublinensis]|uniref:hypothetical protein n=1 Tax=Phyllobacterium lublinensis TaxID=2875708 RepID=UPI001CCBF74E|nr:hypothetical protein [Phyllobacterium sp. 2063]MBZ9653514.1 hypothetical protein [Phyllobacterium sp. 2063]